MWFHFPALPFTLNLALLGLGACSALGQDQSAKTEDLPTLGNMTTAQFKQLQLKANKLVKDGIENLPKPVGATSAEFRHVPLVDLSKKARQLLDREISRIESASSEHIVSTVPRDRIRSIRSPALEALFPDHDFVYISYDMTRRTGSTANVAEAQYLFLTLAIDARAGTTARFSSSGYSGAFGSFLAAQKVTLKTQADAARVCKAAHAVRNDRWFSGKHLREGNDRWKLNWHTYRQGIAVEKYTTSESFYEINTDEDGTVLNGRWRSIRIPDTE